MNIELPQKFERFFEPCRYLVYYGGRGSAKSHSVAMGLLLESLLQPLRILCVREYQNSIADSVHRLLSDKIGSFPKNIRQHFNIKRDSIEVSNGGTFLFEGVAHNIDSIKSMEGIDRCWIEEADRLSQNSWDILSPTIRKEGSKIIATLNPCNESDPIYSMFIAKAPPPNSIVQSVNWNDNPYLPQVLYDELCHMRSNDFEKYLWVWEGKLRTISEAQIFKGKCVVEDFSSDGIEEFYHGMDFGFANDPSVVTRCFIRDGQLFIDKAEFGFGVEINDLIEKLIEPALAKSHYRIKADCARPETISHISNEGYNIVGAKKWEGSVEDGIEFLKGFKRIVLHPSLKKIPIGAQGKQADASMQEEARLYSYKVDRHTNEILPIVLDANNHGWDAIRYSLDDLIKKKKTIYDVGVLS